VAEPRLGPRANVVLDWRPPPVAVANAFAVHADGQEPTERADLAQRRLERADHALVLALELFHDGHVGDLDEESAHSAVRDVGRVGRETLANRAIGFRQRALEQTDIQSFHLLMRAITQTRAVVFQYRKPGSKATGLRRVHPYHLIAFENRWYLLGKDQERAEIRKFVLKRMQKLRLIVGERFERPQDFNPETYLRTSFGIMTGREDYEIAIEMDPWLTDILRGRRWHPSQAWTELPDGSSYLRLRLSCLEEIEQWVLSWGAHATVIRPTALAARVAETARELVAKYVRVNQE